jgi:hypothetical protein
VFADRLIRQGILVRDPVVEAAIQGHVPDKSIRSLQYRFLQATGLTHKTIQQIERARNAVSLLEQGTPILEFWDHSRSAQALWRSSMNRNGNNHHHTDKKTGPMPLRTQKSRRCTGGRHAARTNISDTRYTIQPMSQVRLYRRCKETRTRLINT